MAQVLKGWYGGSTKSDQTLEDETASKFDDKADVFFKHQSARSKNPNLIEKNKANKAHAMTLDYQLRVCPDIGGLQWFSVPAPVGQLGPDEQRYFVDVVDCPRTAQAVGTEKRSCIKNLKTNARRYEVAWGKDRPSLWNCLDGAANGWAHKTRLFYGSTGIRGSEVYDPPHKHARSRENSRQPCSLSASFTP